MNTEDPWYSYVYEGTDTLKNTLGIRDPDELREKEEALVAIRLTQLRRQPLNGSFDREHLKSIHHHLFQDIYPWAGQLRIGPVQGFMSKHDVPYHRWTPDFADVLDRTIARCEPRTPLRRPDTKDFVEHVASFWNEVNHVHPFREGNTRTQSVFFSQYAMANQHVLDIEAITPGGDHHDDFVDARFAFQMIGQNYPLADVLGQITRPATEDEFVDAPRPNAHYAVPTDIDDTYRAAQKDYQRSLDEYRRNHSTRPSIDLDQPER